MGGNDYTNSGPKPNFIFFVEYIQTEDRPDPPPLHMINMNHCTRVIITERVIMVLVGEELTRIPRALNPHLDIYFADILVESGVPAENLRDLTVGASLGTALDPALFEDWQTVH